ncbi:MAG TPA: zinc-dependent alcohol dehydrogenase family protein [Dyella sp.]|nr:zinc-dependent alcohol dehydrogenase family protein [Dyella sp.]
MNLIPDIMQAAVAEQIDTPLRLVDLAVPVPGPGQVLVRVAAAGLNPLDTKIRAGKADHARHPLPAVLGIDLAGTVVALGPDVDSWRIGDVVYGMTGGVGGVQGSLAEYAAVDASLLAPKPAHLSMREAAALPLGFITAYEGLVDRARVHAGQRVLVHGGAGGVGHLAVQLARAHGAEVFATGTAAQKPMIEGYGATAIDYATTPVADYVQAHAGGEGFDIVYDTVGGATLDASFDAVKPYHGHVVSALGWGTHALAPLSFRAGTYSGVFTLRPLLTGEGRAHHGAILREATRLADGGRLSTRLDPHPFTLAEAEQAYRLIEQGGAQGKVVVTVSR